MAMPSYDEIIDKLRSGIYVVEYVDKNKKTVEAYVTMDPDIAILNGFTEFRLTEKRLKEDRDLGLATVGNLQDKKYSRINLKPGSLKSLRRFKGKLVPSRIKGYNVVQMSYEEILSMLIRGKLTVKFIKKDNTERLMIATRNPQIIRALGVTDLQFGSLVEDRKRGLISVFDCEKKAKRVINYQTLVELIGFEGPADSQVKVLRVIYVDRKIQGAEFNIMGEEVTLNLQDTFEIIGMGICMNARIDDRNKITYSSKVPRIDFTPSPYKSMAEVKGIIQDRVHYITTGEVRGVVVAEKKTKDLTKLIELLNAEYGYDIPLTATEIQIEFK